MAVFAQTFCKWRKYSLNLWNNNLKALTKCQKAVSWRNFVLQQHFCKISKILQAKLEYLKNVDPEQFQKSIL